jgi:hemerythrin-like domain-containing protein
MAVQIGAKPDSGFDNPLGMLVDCHRRIERFLQVLCGVAERSHGRKLVDGEKTAVADALRYFRTGGRRHTADEEVSLFPRLRAVEGAVGLDELNELESDHGQAEELHATVDALYTRWIETGSLDANDQELMMRTTRQLQLLYEAHIKVEEGIVFPRATEALDQRTIAEMGREFAERRR